ncbi:MAG: DUF362 domain-containing protein [bacterium]
MPALVLVRKIIELKAAVIEALDFLEYDFTGKKVWVKPNLLGPHPPEAGVTTNPELVSAVVRELWRRGSRQVLVADNPAGVPRPSLSEYLKPTGVVEASEGSFANISINPVRLKLKSRFISEIPVSSIINETDVILNLPVFKTHALTILTGAIKNIFGIIPGGHKAYLHTLATSAEEFAELLVDIYQAVPVPMLHIMDGIRVMDGINGPGGGRVRRMNYLIASANGVALDAVMALLAGAEPKAIPTIRIAAERGLGPMKKGELTIIGDLVRFKDFRLPNAGFAAIITRLSIPVYRFLLPRLPVLKKFRCTRCGQCAENCPVQAIKLSPDPEIDRQKCIRCFCCAEICSVKAMIVAGHLKSFWLQMMSGGNLLK